jgi:hypothetical protein
VCAEVCAKQGREISWVFSNGERQDVSCKMGYPLPVIIILPY